MTGMHNKEVIFEDQKKYRYKHEPQTLKMSKILINMY